MSFASQEAWDGRLAQEYKPYEQFLLQHGYDLQDIAQLRAFIGRSGAFGAQMEAQFAKYHDDVPAQKRIQVALRDLRSVPRAGWVERYVVSADAGNIFAHSIALGDFIRAYAQLEPDMPQDRATLTHMVKISWVHDLIEAITGDFTPKNKADWEVDKPLKTLLEGMAATLVFDGNERSNIKALLDEYETKATPAAQLVSDIDKCLAAVEAAYLERAHPKLNRDFIAARGHGMFEDFNSRLQREDTVKTPIGLHLKAKLNDPAVLNELVKVYRLCHLPAMNVSRNGGSSASR